MNRLTALENNSSLYARFVEEHAASVREMLRRLGEDIGRLEGIVSIFAALKSSLLIWKMCPGKSTGSDVPALRQSV